MNIFGNSRKRSREADAIVTGAGSGIGAAFATELAHRGGRVVCSDIDEAAAQRTAQAITADGGAALALHCDVSRIDQVEHLAEAAQTWFDGPPSLVINNAGVGAGGQPIGDTSLDDWNWVLGINLWGPINGCHVFTPILRQADSQQPRGIINVASAAAFGAAPGMAAYNVSKAGTLSLSETLAAELSGTGINVTVLCPTFVKTNIVQSGRITAQSTQLADRLMRWTGFSPERVARMCLDTNDRGGLYCMPQPDARIGWGIKRLTPTVYTRAVGLTTRITSHEEVS
jgi:NAD(P)-dependent dehydrogenase (short-subunit alcohol dehydrogenase family)